MGSGYLIIQARTAEDAIPIAGARVRVMDSNGRQLYDLMTNESGETELITLETVDRSFTLTPNYTGSPYTSYDLRVDAEGFNSFILREYISLMGKLPFSLFH